MRVGAIDIGTNTVLLLVADVGGDGQLLPIAERATITRLGEGVDRTRQLAPAAVVRTVACLNDYKRIADELGVESLGIVGTSAMRDAAGGASVRDHVRAIFGVNVRVLSGAEEARLTFCGALSGIQPVPVGQIPVFDIGGGSTEVILGTASLSDLTFAKSFDLGSVRLTERFIAHDPPTPDELIAIERVAAESFSTVPPIAGTGSPVGVAGTMTTLGAIALGVAPYEGARIHGRGIRRADLRRVVSGLASIDSQARKMVPGMDPGRADVIVAGGLVALALLDHWGADEAIVSDRGVRWGLAQALAGAPADAGTAQTA